MVIIVILIIIQHWFGKIHIYGTILIKVDEMYVCKYIYVDVINAEGEHKPSYSSPISRVWGGGTIFRPSNN